MEHISAAIYYAPDGYEIQRDNLMGRASAGHGFLRAAARAHENEDIYAFTPFEHHGKHFAKMINNFAPNARPKGILPNDFKKISQIGTLYRPDSVLTMQADFRLRASISAYSLCGVAHTMSTHRPMQAVSEYLSAPLFPWDAMICTSNAVKASVNYILDQQSHYNQWRFGAHQTPALLQLPIIPLGVHTSDFSFTEDQKQNARTHFKVPHDAILCLFMGRLSFHEKAHPFAMYDAINAVAQTTDQEIILLECGWYANEHIEKAYLSAREMLAPNIRIEYVDGRIAENREKVWAACDIFISLSDNIQETFGLTPIEAMSAGVPVIATDWNGYRDTVRHNVDGFLIPTLAPTPYAAEGLAEQFEAEMLGYGHYCGATAMMTSVDQVALFDGLRALVLDKQLRLRFGASGKQRAIELYDWAVIFRSYQELWRELQKIRLNQAGKFKPFSARFSPSKPNPMEVFGSYPSLMLANQHRVKIGNSQQDFKKVYKHPMFEFAWQSFMNAPAFEIILQYVRNKPPSVSVEEICAIIFSQHKLSERAIKRAILVLLKLDFLQLHRLP